MKGTRACAHRNEREGGNPTFTNPSMIVGSPAYMSPEQLASPAEVDARADLWSLGVVLYELLAGRLPFEENAPSLLLLRVMDGRCTPLRKNRSDVPPALESIVHRCLAREPSLRHADVGQLAVALAPFGSGRAHRNVRRAVRLLGGTGSTSPSPSRSLRKALVALGALAAGILVTVAGCAISSSQGAEQRIGAEAR